MPRKKADVKAQLMADAEKAIDQMLVEAEEKGSLTITDIERLARKTGNQVMQEVTQQLAAEQGQQKRGHVCPECGQRMKYKGQKGKNLLTETGEIRLERGYYYCLNCRRGIFPPGPPTGLDEKRVQS